MLDNPAQTPLQLTLTGVESPPTLPAKDAPGVERWCHRNGRLAALGQVVAGRYWMHFPRVASYSFGCEGEVAVHPCPGVSQELIADRFRRTVLPLALQVRGQEVLHASAVETATGVVGLCAPSMTGKSTLAYSLQARGYPLWADDALAFEVVQGARAHPLPFRIRLRRASAAHFGVVSGKARWQGEMQVRAQPRPLEAIFVLARAALRQGSVVELEELPAARAFDALLAHAYYFSLEQTDTKKRMIGHYLKLAACVPVYQVRFKRGLEHLPTTVSALQEVLGEAVAA